jgi:hypothetical protein
LTGIELFVVIWGNKERKRAVLTGIELFVVIWGNKKRKRAEETNIRESGKHGTRRGAIRP